MCDTLLFLFSGPFFFHYLPQKKISIQATSIRTESSIRLTLDRADCVHPWDWITQIIILRRDLFNYLSPSRPFELASRLAKIANKP